MITYSKIGHFGRLGNQLFQFAGKLGIARKVGYKVGFPIENTTTPVTEHFKDGKVLDIVFDVPKAFKLNADLQNFLGITGKEANVNQAVTAVANKAATEIRTPGSGSTSDLEFGAYRAAFPSLATSRQGRELMVEIAEANAKRNSKLADWARINVKQGTFSYEGLAAYDNSLGRAVSVDIENKVKALTGGNKPGANQDLFNQADAIIGGGKR